MSEPDMNWKEHFEQKFGVTRDVEMPSRDVRIPSITSSLAGGNEEWRFLIEAPDQFSKDDAQLIRKWINLYFDLIIRDYAE